MVDFKRWSVTVAGVKLYIMAVDEYTALKAAENHQALVDETKKLKEKFGDLKEETQ